MGAHELKLKLLSTNMFKDNEYLDLYISLMLNNRNLNKIKGKTQSHHILQRKFFTYNKLNIDNSKENLVNLLYKDHILAHYYLCKCTTKWLAKANSVTLLNMTTIKKNAFHFKELCANLDGFQENYEKLTKSIWKHKINYEDLYNYYILENNTKENTAKHFKCDKSNIDRWLVRYNIHKIKPQNRVKIDTNLLLKLYIEEEKSLDELAKYFKVSRSKLKHILSELKIKRNPHANKIGKRKILKTKEQLEEFKDLYLNQNKSITQLGIYYGVSKTCIKRYLKLNNIKKPKNLIGEAIKKGKKGI